MSARKDSEQRLYEYTGDEDYQIRRARFTERWAASLSRLAEEAGNPTERETALIELVRLRVTAELTMWMHWNQDSIDKAAAAAEAYLAEFADGENAYEVRLARAVAGVMAPSPDNWFAPRSMWPEPRCAESLPVFEELSAAGTEDPWSLTALGFKAVCLDRTDRSRRNEIRAAANEYLADEELSSPYDMMLRSELKVALWRVDGLPPFEAEGLNGETVTLADFEGKVTLLDFWSPG